MIVFSAVGAVLFILSIAFVFTILGASLWEIYVGRYTRAADDFTREQLLDLADRRRPGRLGSHSDRRVA